MQTNLTMSGYKGYLTYLLLILTVDTAAPFSINSKPLEVSVNRVKHDVGLQSQMRLESHRDGHSDFHDVGRMTASAALLGMMLLTSSPVFADEFGVETEAPTLFTGETVEICTKRGVLGACLETQVRTLENDNDKANKYFRVQPDIVKMKDAEARLPESSEGNALIERLRRQTEENKERNALLVEQKTFENDQSATFGPFDRQVLIMNVDGRGFTLLENPQAMRLKNDGFIKDRKFIKQPTPEELEAALQPDGPGLFGRIFGGE